MLCHDFDMIHFLSGEFPVEVFSMGHCYNAEIAAMGDIDTVAVMLKFSSGLMAMIDVSRTASYGYDQRIECFGASGMAYAQNVQQNTVVVATEKGFVSPRAEWSFPQRYEAAYPSNVEQFVKMVRSHQAEASPKLQARDMISDWDNKRHIELERVTAAAEISWRIGAPVKLAELDGLRHHLKHHTNSAQPSHL